jgi:hypothetical protein
MATAKGLFCLLFASRVISAGVAVRLCCQCGSDRVDIRQQRDPERSDERRREAVDAAVGGSRCATRRQSAGTRRTCRATRGRWRPPRQPLQLEGPPRKPGLAVLSLTTGLSQSGPARRRRQFASAPRNRLATQRPDPTPVRIVDRFARVSTNTKNVPLRRAAEPCAATDDRLTHSVSPFRVPTAHAASRT